MYSPSRDQARRFLFETWRKYRTGEPVEGLERLAIAVMLLHPEYHAALEDPERNTDRDYLPEVGEVNPFLHLSLHLAIEEQLSIDQPPGILAQYERLKAVHGCEHDAKHDLLECLGETIWQAQRSGAAPDATAYLQCLARRPGG